MATKDQKNLALSETHKHVRAVSKNINIFIKDLIDRAEVHDDSKFEEPEFSIFAENTHKLAGVEYGSPEYKEMMEEIKPAIEHHCARNRHHPEFHKDGIDGMDLMDLVELICDWQAATKRNKNGNIRKSLEVNVKRHKISPQLRKILENTVDRYF
jgi:hypothetical protein